MRGGRFETEEMMVIRSSLEKKIASWWLKYLRLIKKFLEIDNSGLWETKAVYLKKIDRKKVINEELNFKDILIKKSIL